MAHYSIGQLAKLANMPVDTLRYYEKQGLIDPPHRGENRYRYYNDDAVARLGFILRAKSVGFSLKEIQELLALKLDRSRHTCREVKSYALHKLELIDEKIAQLQLIRRALTEIAGRCEGNDDSAESCLILQALENAVSSLNETA
jgi:MerR family Zn(II)-responsive transcriptional regulator of zntA